MNIFVVNCGSSSIKYQLFKWPSEEPICSGLVERIGLENSVITHKVYTSAGEQVIKRVLDLPDHEAGMQEVGALLTEPGIGVIQNPEEIEAVGHRIVHGGESFVQTTIVTPEVKEEIKRLAILAPLHNPGHYVGINVAQKIFSKATHVVVFDTAFHATMPEKAFRYAIPESFYTDYGVRVYGFHGTSHKYVSEQAIAYLEKPDAKIITIHLGNGCSMAAVDAGVCVDTSMGLGPLDGLIMGTRCGNIDPSVVFFLVSQLGYDIAQVDNLFNKQSGMLGLTGFSDMRDILKAIDAGDEKAKLAYDMYAYRIKKYIGSYAVAMNGLDAIIFTAGVGENDDYLREAVCAGMDFTGIKLDTEKNHKRAKGLREVNLPDSKVKVLIVPTNEELEIAKECFELLEK
ncbi:Acetate kinase [Arcticibacter svalbardensis MN12-7]|uniref:Acetate kinase n=1 Tax=Arcticibacter svalbardensis MN12-7 TaxID=1150600 RepID=R9H221_9SPHI|nr:acetate kinase [Arcticibacter svalbardensis]EOR95244.1 Acetate kinase [Arcticibacter svalbardensis MN12-7]